MGVRIDSIRRLENERGLVCAEVTWEDGRTSYVSARRAIELEPAWCDRERIEFEGEAEPLAAAYRR